MKPMPSREAVIAAIKDRYPDHAMQVAAWSRTDLTGVVSEAEWREAHSGVCVICRAEGARLYASGWACTEHAPRSRPREAGA